jgi:hypothetical protein
MGLTIYYSLKTKATPDAARGIVARMHQAISKLPWDKVSQVFEIDPPDGKYTFQTQEADHFKFGAEYLNRTRADGEKELVEVPSLHVMFFAASVEGAESARFGLASHPPVVVHHEDVIEHDADGSTTVHRAKGDAIEVPTRLRGMYSWQDFCKTQYASNPKLGGEDNFLRAHLSLFGAIDICNRLGLRTSIRDDARYYRHGDVQKLLESLRWHNELVAGFVGKLSDALGNTDGGIVAPIKDHTDFEHLEARGIDKMKTLRKGRRKK